MRKHIGPIALAAALAFGASGCYGSFTLTKKLHKWNGSLGNQWANEAVFLLIGAILPVYGITCFVDAVVLNSVEFWSGKNPMAQKVVTSGDKQAVMQFDEKSGTVKVSYYDKGAFVGQTLLQKTDKGLVALDADGSVAYSVGTDMNGVLSVADASGLVVAQSVQ